MHMSFLNVFDLSFTYPDNNIHAVKNVSFDVQTGEYVAVLGANGSGKSTLARLLCGFLEPDSGKIEIEKNNLRGIVFQSPDDQIVASIVESDTAFGLENLKLPEEEIDSRVTERLECVGLSHKKTSQTFALSQGQKQKLAFAGITAMKPSLLVLDEAVSMLDEKSRIEILDLIDDTVKSGCTVIHITHDLSEACRANRIIAMDDGSIIYDGSKDDFMKQPNLVKQLFGEPLSSFIDSEKNGVIKSEKASFSLENICFSYSADSPTKIFENLSLNLFPGTLNALMGPSGSGKSTLLEIAGALLVPESGQVLCDGTVSLVLQDSERALFEEFAADDVAFGPRNQGLSGKVLVERVRNSMDMVNLPFDEFAERRTLALSGGQKRKLALAGIIALDSDVILFDEPTAALDPQSRCHVMQILRQLADNGKTVLFSTHRKEEAEFADSVIRLKDTNPVVLEQAEAFCKSESDDSQKISKPEKIQKHYGTEILSFLRNCSNSFSSGSLLKYPVQSMNAICKYLVFFALFLASFLTQKIAPALMVLGCGFIYSVLAHYPLKKLMKSFLKIFPWIFLFFIFQMFFLPAKPNDTELLKLGFVVITQSKLESGLLMFLHLLSAFITIAVFVFSTSETHILEGLKSLLRPLELCKIPVRHIVLVAGIVFRFVPMLAAEASLIVKVQIIRGGLGEAKGFMAKIKSIFPLFVPLFLRTLRRADSLADALTARNYS